MEQFVVDPGNILLLLTLSPDGFLIPYAEFTSSVKTKSVYFIKAAPCCLTDENKNEVLVIGDCSGVHVVNYLELLTNEVGDRKIFIKGETNGNVQLSGS